MAQISASGHFVVFQEPFFYNSFLQWIGITGGLSLLLLCEIVAFLERGGGGLPSKMSSTD